MWLHKVLETYDIEKTVITDTGVLVKVHAATVSSGDVRLRNGPKDRLPLWSILKLVV